jgi:hypothetical protein
MKVTFPDYDAGRPVEREVPDDLVKAFLDWLMVSTARRLVDNPDILAQRVWKLRTELAAGASRLAAEAQRLPQAPALRIDDAGHLYEGEAPAFELTAKGVLALADVETNEELLRLVELGREFDRLTSSPATVITGAPADLHLAP